MGAGCKLDSFHRNQHLSLKSFEELIISTYRRGSRVFLRTFWQKLTLGVGRDQSPDTLGKELRNFVEVDIMNSSISKHFSTSRTFSKTSRQKVMNTKSLKFKNVLIILK